MTLEQLASQLDELSAEIADAYSRSDTSVLDEIEDSIADAESVEDRTYLRQELAETVVNIADELTAGEHAMRKFTSAWQQYRDQWTRRLIAAKQRHRLR